MNQGLSTLITNTVTLKVSSLAIRVSDMPLQDLKRLWFATLFSYERGRYSINSGIARFLGNYFLGFLVDNYGFVTMCYAAALISAFSIPILVLLSQRDA